MKNFCDRVLALLNETEIDQIFGQFIDDLGELPKCTYINELGAHCITDRLDEFIHREPPSVASYFFVRHGFSLNSIFRIFHTANFHVKPVNLEDWKTVPYMNDLPFGLAHTDNRQGVRSKLGQPLQSIRVGNEHISEPYDVEHSYPMQIVCWYTMPNEDLSELRVAPRKLRMPWPEDIAEQWTHTPPFEPNI